MLSYEDIFMRHNAFRPLSYLSSHLDSPAVSRRQPVILRSFPLNKSRRPRPVSSSSLDSLPKYYRDSFFLENTPRLRKTSFSSSSENIPNQAPLVSTPKHHTTSFKTPLESTPKQQTTSYKAALASTPRHHRTSFTNSLESVDGHHNDKSSKKNVLKYYADRYKTSEDNLNGYCNDNYRLVTTFPERRLRRQIPLCTPDELLDIIREPSGYYALPTDPWNEVYPDIYLSDAPTALCTSVLKRIGITHVLNAAQGKEKNCGQVNTSSGFYSQSGIQFLGVPAFDNVVFRIYPYFEEAAEFIEDGLKSKGKVLVHCRAGISRSATLVCAFLMLKRSLTVQEAVKIVRKNRAIIPNDGFLQQLCDLNDKLKRKCTF